MTFSKPFAPQRTIQKRSLNHIQVLLSKRTKGEVLHLSLHREPQRGLTKVPQNKHYKNRGQPQEKGFLEEAEETAAESQQPNAIVLAGPTIDSA